MNNFFVQPNLTILFLLLAYFQGSFCLTPEQRQLIDEVVEVYMRDNFIPGLGLSIVENYGSNALSIGYGRSRIETNTSATSQTLFAIGSISKSFTGVLVAKVLNDKFPELGELALDTPIADLAPDFNFTFSDSRSRYLSEICSFRTSFVYNNNLYSLAGNLIAHIAGTTFRELTNYFFNQLGMSSTRLAAVDGSYEELPNMSHAYFRKNNNETLQFNTTHLRRLAIVGGAGAILSTSTDMSQYLGFHLNKGRVGNTQVIPEEVLNWVYKVAIPMPPFEELPLVKGAYGYGLGVFLAVYKGNPWINHGGYWPPYESFFSLFPEQGFGTFITINGPGITGTYPGQITQQQLQLIIYDIVHGDLTKLKNIDYGKVVPKNMFYDVLGILSKQIDVTKRVDGLNKFQVRKKVERVEPVDIIGAYGSPADGDVIIAIESDDSLSINFGTWGLGTLHQTNETTFSVQWISNVEDDFYSNGNIDAIPSFTIDFSLEEEFVLRSNFGFISFYKNRVIDMIPPIPWDPSSCGPLV